jgi:hypothetical protein
MKTTMLVRQGDVLLERIAELPSTAKRQRVKGPIILAYGEATGHHHAIHKGKVALYRDENQASFIEVKNAVAALEHQEHAPISLAPGVYRVRLQREYSPEEIRRVAD